MDRVSVVVPVYDVEPYLRACLASLAAQTWPELEIVMVDDGSPDASAEIAAEFAERDRRFRLLRQANAGLGAARNTGIRAATGDYLAFVDSDDLLPLDAVETLVATLQATGSDLVTGNVQRFNGRRVTPSRMHKAIFEECSTRTHVTEREILMKDRLVTNKLWRRSFWDAHGLSFPEGVLYEDIAVALPGHFLARSVDMVPAPIYLWREREGERLSITQDRAQVKGVVDRLSSVRSVREFLGSRSPGHVPAWDRMVLESELSNFFEAVETGDEEFRTAFRELAGAYADQATPGSMAAVHVLRRIKWHLIRGGDLAGLAEVHAWERQGRIRAVRRGTKYQLDCPVPGLPEPTLRVDRELDVQQRVDSLHWQDGKLVVTGRAGIRYLRPARRFDQFVFAAAVHEESGRRVRLAVKKSAAPPLGKGKHPVWGGFAFTVDPARLRPGRWRIMLTVIHRGLVRREAAAQLTPALAREAGAGRSAGGVQVTPRRNSLGRFVIDVAAEEATVTSWRIDGGELILSGRFGPHAALVASKPHGGRTLVCPVASRDGSRVASLPLSALVQARRPDLDPDSREARVLEFVAQWSFQAGQSPVRVEPGAMTTRHMVGERQLVAGPGLNGEFQVRDQAPAAVLAEPAWDGSARLGLRAGLPYPVEGAVELVLDSRDSNAEYAFPATCDGRTVTGTLAPMELDSPAGRLPLPAGEYGLAVRTTAGDIPVEYTALDPLTCEHSGRTLSLLADLDGRALLAVPRDLRPDERGATNQARLREVYYPARCGLPLREEIFFDSYTGKQFSDSPKAIYEELLSRGCELPMAWNVRDGQVALPDGVTPVRLHGAEYYDALARSRYIVTNAHLPGWFRRREGQTVLQTWHGSTLKKIGFDIEKVLFAKPDYHERLATEIDQWSYLVSPSPWCSPILTRAFRFKGELLETGYPRNDVLHRADLVEEVRRRLGLPPGKRVVLYAPTWRDDKFHGKGKYRFELKLDLERMWRELGDDHVVLVRRHPNVTDHVRPVGHDFVLDVSLYPDIQELYLVADLLITDYSSAMFDFAVTGRPILFYTYDLEHYRDTLRGFYFDFEAEAPGPLLRSTEEVVEAVRGIEETTAKYQGLYAAFVAKFCPLDDGMASARVVDRVFPDWPRWRSPIGQEEAWTSSSSSRE
ncbi:bifunctional glycosyltransferase family 2 protein/CDP-glycerol:glycerophosphate glycerophosphotransferase [Nonomuraea sp. NPDC050310]|uniref:bifunctional glycosyltransferase/CDP-glycerol:glycerophosphate glycerophosphotransferase n=1 Tax=Nonomuraea sp. NPDC050310 TaxID=3154935 RepID=UPI0033DA4421